jgi:hypothetical protein
MIAKRKVLGGEWKKEKGDGVKVMDCCRKVPDSCRQNAKKHALFSWMRIQFTHQTGSTILNNPADWLFHCLQKC